MLIVITDEGRLWNHNEPSLEQYADRILVVCLNGKQVTEKYRCFINPYENIDGRREFSKGVTDRRYQALLSVSDELLSILDQHEDVIFLTDGEPNSLFPYQVLKEKNRNARFHLWCMLPFLFEGKRRRSLYKGIVNDFISFKSVICFDDQFCKALPREKRTLTRIFDAVGDEAKGRLPSVLSEIENNMKSDSSFYFDFKAGRYLEIDHLRFQQTLADYSNFENKKIIERAYPRINGKDICEQLKQMRRILAEANGIEFECAECPSTGPCAGTCPRCDQEILELERQLAEIPYADRVYPEFVVENICKGLNEPKPAPEADFDDITIGFFPVFFERPDRKSGGEKNE